MGELSTGQAIARAPVTLPAVTPRGVQPPRDERAVETPHALPNAHALRGPDTGRIAERLEKGARSKCAGGAQRRARRRLRFADDAHPGRQAIDQTRGRPLARPSRRARARGAARAVARAGERLARALEHLVINTDARVAIEAKPSAIIQQAAHYARAAGAFLHINDEDIVTRNPPSFLVTYVPGRHSVVCSCGVRRIASILGAVFAVSQLTACGMIFQTIAGFDDESKTVEAAEHQLEINSLPSGADVYEVRGEESERVGQTPIKRTIAFERELTIETPKSMLPYWLGTALDVAGVIGAGFITDRYIIPELDKERDRRGAWLIYVNLVASVVGEIIVGGILMGREKEISVRDDKPTSYVFTVSKRNHPEIMAKVDVPQIGKRVTIPLDQWTAQHLNKTGAPILLVVTKSSTAGAVRPPEP